MIQAGNHYEGGVAMKHTARLVAMCMASLMAASSFLSAAPRTENRKSITVPQGTTVVLTFDKGLSSKTAKVGQPVSLHVRDNVTVEGKTILKRGTSVTGTVSKVDKRKRYGINATMRITLDPVRSTYGGMIPLEPRSKGQSVGGKKSNQAAGATAGGAILLGPIGLAGGYFIKGKPMTIKAGDTLLTEVTRDTVLRWGGRSNH
jgi:hypothetical protein